MSDDRLQDVLKNLSKRNITASLLSDETSPCVVHDFLSTGCHVLDAAMSLNAGEHLKMLGIPLGRITEIHGDPSTGKSLIAAQVCAMCQELGGIAVYIDTETAVSLPIMHSVGVDIEKLIYTAPDTVEEVFSAIEGAIESKQDTLMVVVWDTIAGTSSEAEMEKATGETGYLRHAAIISQGLRKMARKISQSKIAILLLNQAKEQLGVMFGNKVTTFGGKGPVFYASVRVQLSIHATLKADKRAVGISVKAKVVKNKIAPPLREVLLPIYFGYGIDDAEASLEYLKDAKFAVYGGGYYTVDGFEEKVKSADWTDWYEANREKVCALIDGHMTKEDRL